MALPFADAAFDAAFSNFGLFLFSDRGKGLSELFRVVKTQSKVGISSWSPATGPIEAMYRVVREVLPDLPFQEGGAPLGSKEDIVKEMCAAGFENVSVEPAFVTFSFPSVEAFWEENSRASGPLVATRRRVSANEWPAIESRILDALRTSFPREVHYDREALIGVARKPVHCA